MGVLGRGAADYYTHGGAQYLLGRDALSPGVWVRGAEDQGPVERFVDSPAGWDDALAALLRRDRYVTALPARRSGLAVPGTAGRPGLPAANGVGTAGGVVGIVGAVLSLIPLLGIPIGLVLGLVATVLGGVGTARPAPAPKGMAVAGLVLGILTLVFKSIPGVDLL